MKYTCTLVRIYTNIHIPIDTYTLIMFMFKPYDSFHSPAINIHIGYIYILTPALVTLEDDLKGRNQTATTKILTHTATYKEHGPSTAAPDANTNSKAYKVKHMRHQHMCHTTHFIVVMISSHIRKYKYMNFTIVRCQAKFMILAKYVTMRDGS